MKIRVSLIDGVDGRIIESGTFVQQDDAEADVLRLTKLAGDDMMVVFHVLEKEE